MARRDLDAGARRRRSAPRQAGRGHPRSASAKRVTSSCRPTTSGRSMCRSNASSCRWPAPATLRPRAPASPARRRSADRHVSAGAGRAPALRRRRMSAVPERGSDHAHAHRPVRRRDQPGPPRSGSSRAPDARAAPARRSSRSTGAQPSRTDPRNAPGAQPHPGRSLSACPSPDPRHPSTLEGFELRVLQIPLVSPFTTSFGTETVREVIVVRALTADGEGWGEIVTGAAPLYSSEYTQGAWDVAAPLAHPRAARTGGPLAPEDVAAIARAVRRPPHGEGRPRARRARCGAARRGPLARRVPRRRARPRSERRERRHPARSRGPRRGRRAATSTRATCASRSRSSPAATSPRPPPCATRSAASRCRSTRTPPTRSPTSTPSPSSTASTCC